MAKKRLRYRATKAQGIFGIIIGVILFLNGIFVAIPSIGTFGVIWTLGVIGITAYNAYCTFVKGYFLGTEVEIEDDETGVGYTREERLKELRRLYDRRLITEEEYETKREEILKEL